MTPLIQTIFEINIKKQVTDEKCNNKNGGAI
jgi:hypothetical protein